MAGGQPLAADYSPWLGLPLSLTPPPLRIGAESQPLGAMIRVICVIRGSFDPRF